MVVAEALGWSVDGTILLIGLFSVLYTSLGGIVADIWSDVVQLLGKAPIDAAALPVDYLSMAAHKLHGPKGVGALYSARRAPLTLGISDGNETAVLSEELKEGDAVIIEATGQAKKNASPPTGGPGLFRAMARLFLSSLDDSGPGGLDARAHCAL